MIQAVNCAPQTVKAFTSFGISVPGKDGAFPLLQIDRDSYIVGAEIQSGINFHIEDGVHCIQIGKYCSLAERITFMVDLNHDYQSVAQGDAAFLRDAGVPWRTRRKGSILIQHDVWIGHGATLLSGITVHNGAVIAAEAVVTKDVPAYAIVGGNPAKVIGWRFSEEQIRALLTIGWWDWDEQKAVRCREDFTMDAGCFIERHLPEAEECWPEVVPGLGAEGGSTILFIPDLTDPFPLWRKILTEYLSVPRSGMELVIYLLPEAVKRGLSADLLQFLEAFGEQEAFITVQDGQEGDDLRCLFASSDYFVTTRSAGTIAWTCFADYYQVKLLYGTDIPVFSGM